MQDSLRARSVPSIFERHPLHGERLDHRELFPDRTLRLKFGGQRITLADLLAASSRLLGILTDVDARITDQPGGSVDWVIRDLQPGSAILEIEAQPKGEQTPFGAEAEIVRQVKAGMRQVVERGERPPFFSERAMQQTYELTTLLSENGIQDFTLGFSGEAVEFTPGMRKAVKQTLEGKYRAIGSIEARIEMLSAHEPPYSCTAWTLLTNEAIRCYFTDSALLKTAYEHFKQRVTLRGILNSRADGEVTSMRVHSIEPFPSDDDLPTVDDIRGIMANGS